MTKEEKIQEAYGEYWETVKNYVDESGHCTMYDKSTKVSPNFLELGMSREYVESKIESGLDNDSNLIWRPKSLQEIDHNNGWIKIENGNIEFKNNELTCLVGYFNINKKFIYREMFTADIVWAISHGRSTHYKIIEKEKPPIY
jgi:hypothetical protein